MLCLLEKYSKIFDIVWIYKNLSFEIYDFCHKVSDWSVAANIVSANIGLMQKFVLALDGVAS